jgi:hypothetical protein
VVAAAVLKVLPDLALLVVWVTMAVLAAAVAVTPVLTELLSPGKEIWGQAHHLLD